MRIVVQRVRGASVSVNGELRSKISKGVCALVGLSKNDTVDDIKKMATKLINLRIFSSGDDKKWDKSVKDMGYEILVVSQFTLYSKLKGNKPDFHDAMNHVLALEAFNSFVEIIKEIYSPDMVQTGCFREYMALELSNDGPVTIILESSNQSTQQ